MQVVDMNPVFDRMEPEVVRLADGLPAFDAAARHPYRETLPMMIASASSLLARHAVFHQGRAPKLAAPNDECVLEQPPLFKVLDQRRCRTVDDVTVVLDALDQVAVVVPAPVNQEVTRFARPSSPVKSSAAHPTS